MNELVKLVDRMMISRNAATQSHWNRKSDDEKRAFAYAMYKMHRAKNWKHLPAEIKLECIKSLDFKERLKLRMTARQERELVDSLTIDFPSVQFINPKAPEPDFPRHVPRGMHLYPWVSRGSVEVRYPPTSPNSNSSLEMRIIGKKYMSAVHLLAYALKIGKIENLKIFETYSPKRFNHCVKILEKSAPFRVKNLDIVAQKPAVFTILNNLELTGLETIRLNAEKHLDFPMGEISEMPAVTKCKLLEIIGLASGQHVVTLIKKWIEKDVQVGTKLHASVVFRGSEFASKFKKIFVKRIESQKEEQVRIRTDNAAKHVLLKWGLVGEDWWNQRDYISCTVIPSDFKDSDVEDFRWTSSFCDDSGLWNDNSSWEKPDPRLAAIIEEIRGLIRL